MPRSKIITGLKQAVRHARERNMTEREYVELIRSKAEAYMAELNNEQPRMKPITEWENVKVGLSAQTMAVLCEAWLGAEAIRAEIEGTEAE
jgi:hypothetical protein